jgi:hypothetical protein
MRLLLLTMMSAGLALPAIAQNAGTGFDNPTVPGTVRAQSPGATGAPAEMFGTRANTGANTGNDSSYPARGHTDNAPIRNSDLTEIYKYPPAPSLRPWEPLTTDNYPATTAPPR